MGAIKEAVKYIEVVSLNTAEGELIPLKIKVQDEDGEFQSYAVKGYKPIHCNNNHRCFDCKIESFGMEHIVRIFYNRDEYKWHISN